MKKIEWVLISLAVAGIILRIFAVDGSLLLMAFSMTLLSLVYLVLGFALLNHIRLRDIFKKNAYQHTNAASILWAVFGGIASWLAVLGILFSIAKWEGGPMILTVALALLIIMGAASIINLRSRPSAFYKSLSIRLGVLTIISAATFFCRKMGIW